MNEFDVDFIQPGDPIIVEGVFGVVVGFGSIGQVAVVLAERGGMPGKTYGMSADAARLVRDVFYADHGCGTI